MLKFHTVNYSTYEFIDEMLVATTLAAQLSIDLLPEKKTPKEAAIKKKTVCHAFSEEGQLIHFGIRLTMYSF